MWRYLLYVCIMNGMAKERMKKPRFGLLWAVAGIAVLAIAAVVWAFWYDLSIGFDAPAHPDFMGYIPSTKLNGASLTGTKLIRYSEFGLDYWWFDYVLTYDSGVTVYERSADTYPEVVANCKFLSVGQGDYSATCSVHAIKNGGRYMVRADEYKGKVFSADIEALIGNTEVYVSVPADQREEYTAYKDWQAFFDSFEPVDLQTMPFTSKTHHQGGV